MNPRVSVVMPVFNGEQFIAAAIESVLRQTYSLWELIVVNDGSTDSTAAIVERFVDPRIHSIMQENQGLARARNAGIRAAQGEFLAFLDADDEWTPGFFERCMGELEQSPALAGVYTLNHYIGPDGERLPRLGGQALLPGVLYDRLLQGGFFAVCSVLVRSDVVREVGSFDTSLSGQGTEDWDLWLRIAKRYAMAGIPAPLACYRVYPGSMATNTAKMHANRMSVLSKHFGPLQDEPATSSEEKRRAYAFAYRSAALAHLQQKEADTAWQWMGEAARIWPPILTRLDTFYELALGDQPRGFRGQADARDVARNGAELLQRLDRLFETAAASSRALSAAAYGNACLALAMLSDQAGDWPAARAYLLQAVRHYPRLLSRAFLRRLLKVSLGKRVIAHLKAFLGRLGSLDNSNSPSGERGEIA